MKYVIIGMLMALSTACATLVSVDSKNTFQLDLVTASGEVVKISCTTGLTKTTLEGEVVVDADCTGYYEDANNVYSCEIGVNSNGKPITKEINIKEFCKISMVK